MCKQCEKNPVYEFTNQRKLCRLCFIKYFHKKVFYTIRKFKMINNGDFIGYENKGDFRGVVLEEVLKMFSEKAMVEIVKKSKKANKIAISNTIDLESDKIIHTLFKGNIKDIKSSNKDISQM